MAEPRWLPQSLLGRLTLVMVVGVLLAQLAANAIWAWQLRAKAAADTVTAAQHLGHSAANSLRFFRSVPANYRPLVIQQFRDMGGTRFFVNVASAQVAVQALESRVLADSALQHQRARRSRPICPSCTTCAWPSSGPSSSAWPKACSWPTCPTTGCSTS